MAVPQWEAAERRGRLVRDGLLILFIISGAIYLSWRLSAFNVEAPVFSWVFWSAEVLAYFAALIRLFVTRRADLAPPDPPPAPEVCPSIDVFITTYHEPLAVLRRTVAAAVAMRGEHVTWLLDDAARPEMAVGGAYEHHSIKNDPTNPVQGAKWGAKGQIEVYAQPSPNSMFLGIASYSGANKTYFGLAKAGWRVSEKSVYFGPEIGVNGNERYDQVRGGLHVTGYQVGPVGFSASVGYVKNSPGDGGAYGGVGFTFRY